MEIKKLILNSILPVAVLILHPPFVFADTTVSCLGYSFSVPGDIALDGQFQGTLMVTTPTGEVILVNEGDPVPTIPSGSTVEIFKGQANFKAGGKEAVDLACEKDTEGTGEAKILTDGINVSDPAGDSKILQTGVVYPISILEAPPTGQTPPEGTPVGDLPPVDNRNVPQSP